MKKIMLIGIVTILLISTSLVTAIKPQDTPTNKEKGFTLPENAKEISPGVYDLGIKIHKGKKVQGYAFVDYKKGYGKPTGCNNDGVCQGWEDADCVDCSGGGGEEPPQEEGCNCYVFLSRGAKWKTIEPWIVNTANNEGLNGDAVFDILLDGVVKWETAAGKDILGSGSTTTETLVADTVSPDDENEVYFGDIAEQGAIAVTIIWGVFGGPPPRRQLVEWDMIFDQVDFDWSVSGESNKMDFDNIATHELGHSCGLGDLYTSDCSQQTMYGYASEGETNKRNLECGDITGISDLYK
jgi:hypothetical protein